MTLFALENVNYKDIIKYPDIRIPADGVTFICGESGSGKSTLLKLLNGVISATSGTITYLGSKIEDYEPIELRRNVLLISQSVYLFDKSIKENFNEYYAYRDLKVIADETMKKFLNICLADFPLDSMCNVMSGGERQRVFIAINLSYQPKVLMMDEPTSALDDKNADTLIKNIKSYCKANKISLIIVSHDKTIADRYADNIINLLGGSDQ